MNNLEYDNLYKFLVSLGIILIAFPVVALVYISSTEPILISQTDFDVLSQFSLQMIDNRTKLADFLVVVFPWASIISIALGIILLVCGIIKWISIQNKLDTKLDAETTIQTLNLLEMSNKEVADKIEEETKEAAEINSENQEVLSVNSQTNSINKYMEIEDLCFSYINKKYTRKYDVKRNIRIGKYSYDFICVSKYDNIDLIMDVKYWKSAMGVSKRLHDMLGRFYDSGINYETIAHRNFRCILIIVTAKDQLPYLETNIERYRQAHRDIESLVEIKCFAEEAL